jgi:bacteriorhodopsin
MSEQNPRRASRLWAVVAVLLAVGIVVPLLVGLYDSVEPRLGGFPFYYWFQFLLIPVVSLLTFIAFRLSLKATEQDRPTFGLPAEPGDDTRTSGSER